MISKNALLAVILFLLFSSISAAQSDSTIICPSTIHTISDEGKCGSKAEFTNPFEESNLDGVQFNYASDSWFDVGSTSVYYKGVDKLNNTHFCIFKVLVLDEEKPQLISSMRDITLISPTSAGLPVFWEIPEVTDNCSQTNYISTHDSGEVFPAGETEVTYWFYDSTGNMLEMSFLVHVSVESSFLATKE